MCSDLWGPEKVGLCYSCLLISSTIRPYLDPDLFFLLPLICSQGGEGGKHSAGKKKKKIQTSCQRLDLLTRTAMKICPLLFLVFLSFFFLFGFLSFFAKSLSPVTCLKQPETFLFFSLLSLVFWRWYRRPGGVASVVSVAHMLHLIGAWLMDAASA